MEKELMVELGICQPAVSKHIKLLLLAGIIVGQRDGMEVRFRITSSIEINQLIDTGNLFAKRFRGKKIGPML